MNLFPHETIRKSQDELLQEIEKAIENKQNAILHAPTGLGKTVSALVPALNSAMKKDLTIFFLTSRHTQHRIALETLQMIREKSGKNISAVSLLGKKWFCLQSGAQSLLTREFAEYCRHLVEEDRCEYYLKFKKKGKVSVDAKKTVELLKKRIYDSEEVIKECEKYSLCPYEVSVLLSKDSRVIITDYYYLFNERIRNGFLKKIDKEFENCVVIVDEAHNLPSRIKDLATERISNTVLQRALSEAKKFAGQEVVDDVKAVENVLKQYSKGFHHKSLSGEKGRIVFNEKYLKREDFIERMNSIKGYDELIEEFKAVAEDVVEAQRNSSIGRIAGFLEAWKQEKEGFARILSVDDKNVVLSYRCLDPSVVTKDTINSCYSCILMSGTLTPTSMYKALLGVDNSVEKEFENPFPEKNRLNLIIPQTSTKFATRSPEQYKKIAEIVDKVVSKIPGNCLVFFPSYALKHRISDYLKNTKTLFHESPGLSKSERNDLLDRFKEYKDSGALLLAVMGGSFGEGIDLPGDYLKGVVIVGLPLQKPDLETQSLINYYDDKFGKGWDYGYVFPAFTKTIQSAGRCIRSESDKGVIVFVDERYAWPRYKSCFPKDWDIKVSLLYEKMVEGFFN